MGIKLKMKTHVMHLAKEPFEWVKTKRKTVEIRLFDEKRKKIELGDIIIFKKLDKKVEEIRVQVKGLLRFKSFRDLFLFIPKNYLCHDSLSLEEQIKRMRKYYSEEKEKRYGVIGIWFEEY